MKQITGYDELLEYLNRLGFALGSGSIQHRQDLLCCMADAICDAAGVKIGAASGKTEPPYEVGFPFGIRFTNHIDQDTGYRYPWLGSFSIPGQAPLMCSGVNLTDWLRKRGQL